MKLTKRLLSTLIFFVWFSAQANNISVVDHYEIIHDGQGLTCDTESAMVKACADANCSTLSTQSVSLDFLANGKVISSSTFKGSATITFNNTDVETLTFSLANTSITATNPQVCNDGSGNSCGMEFDNVGFRFLYGPDNSATLPMQTSGSVFTDTLKLQAVKALNGACIGLFLGKHDVDLSQQNIAPDGAVGLDFTIAGDPIAKHPSVTSTTLDFGINSIATIPAPTYYDAGQIRLYASYNIGSVKTLAGSSNAFWVSPAELVVRATSGSTNLDGAAATSSKTYAAGDSFALTVTALNSLGVVTPNYLPGQIQLMLTRMAPRLSDSVDGNFTYGPSSAIASSASPAFQDVMLSSFSFGESAYNSAQYSEVGLLKLDVQDSNYGNENMIIPAIAINIGRFIPEHFTQTVVDDGYFIATCNASIELTAYSGQLDEATNSIGAISYLSNPILAITAYNKQGNITQNYYEDSEASVNDYMKLSASDISVITPTMDQVAIGVDNNKLSLTANMNTGTLSQTNLTASSSGVALPKGTLHYQLSDADHFFYNRSANALVAPFTSDIDFSIASIIDTDNVSVTTTVDASPTGVEIRFGRLLLENSFGPETSNFPQLMKIEHFDGNAFIADSGENCASYDAGRILLTNISLNPSLTRVLGGTGLFINGKTQTIELEAPGIGNQGQIGVLYDAYDWFKYDWDNDSVYDDSPSSTATFGIFRGNDRTTFWREVFH
jgi:MSHA biogenesis protein MshQ